MEISQGISNSAEEILLIKQVVLQLQGKGSPKDDSGKGNKRAERQCRDPGDPLTDGAPKGEHPTKSHHHPGDDMVDQIALVGKAFDTKRTGDDPIEEGTRQYPKYDSNAEVYLCPGIGHDVTDGISDRGYKGQGFERNRIKIIGPEDTCHIPCPCHQDTDHDSCNHVVGTGSKITILEGIPEGGQADHQSNADPADIAIHTGNEGNQGGETLIFQAKIGQINACGLNALKTNNGQQAIKCCIGSDSENQQNHQRFKVSIAGSYQCALATPGAQGHPDPKDDTTDDIPQPSKIGAHIDRLGEIKPAHGMHQLTGKDSNSKCQHPGSKTNPGTHVDPVADGAHNTKLSGISDGSEQHRPHKTPQGYSLYRF